MSIIEHRYHICFVDNCLSA